MSLIPYFTVIEAHHGFGEIFAELWHWIIRGFGWRLGARMANSLPIGVVFLIAIVVGIGYLWYRHQQTKTDHDDQSRHYRD